jgi:hypothetical protein
LRHSLLSEQGHRDRALPRFGCESIKRPYDRRPPVSLRSWRLRRSGHLAAGLQADKLPKHQKFDRDLRDPDEIVVQQYGAIEECAVGYAEADRTIMSA